MWASRCASLIPQSRHDPWKWPEGATVDDSDEAVRGPLVDDGPASGVWTVIRPKSSGVSPGFTMRDVRGDVWFVTFDAKGYPEAASGAILVANKIFWALGYWQAENHLISIRT